ncbi:hypothetical protein [Lentzea albida]|uniref:Small secreted domain n=1 Tax=Lentzea albida TaxID=65499 RepID=A0A1H9WG43_9PSEU|nr:hypothetical protein [Lentzea albida]SES32896.1 hypothetical protein SAMN04488000_12266 [Lentzea albida]
MLKKACAVAAVGAGFLMMGTPAFATQDEPVDIAPRYDHTHQVGLVNLDESEVLSDLNVCHVDVNVIAVPLFSNNDSGTCANPDLDVHGDSDR